MTSIENIIEDMRNRLEKIQARLTELRKKGYDTSIAELKVTNIPSKIKILEVTEREHDIGLVNELISDLILEIEDIQTEKDKSKSFHEEVKQEINKALERHQESASIMNREEGSWDYSSMEIVKRTKKLIEESYNYIEENDYDGALNNYKEIQGIYKFLPHQLKEAVYNQCIEIYQNIIKGKHLKVTRPETRDVKIKHQANFYKIGLDIINKYLDRFTHRT